jgi:hypothetical protein
LCQQNLGTLVLQNKKEMAKLALPASSCIVVMSPPATEEIGPRVVRSNPTREQGGSFY